MSRYRLIVVLVPFLAANFACSRAPIAQNADADKAAIRMFIDRATELNQAGATAAWVAMFAEGGAYMPANGPEVTGRSGLQAVAERQFAQFQPQITITPVEIEVFGDWAFAKAIVAGTLQPRAGGDPVTIDAKEIAVYRRQQDGGWKLWRLIGNSNRS
jgi:uncharacterized protein (TIGR02246 family)